MGKKDGAIELEGTITESLPNAMFRVELAALDVVLYRLFDAEARAGPSDLLDDGTGKCFICDGYVEWCVVDCPGCRGRHRKHATDARCKLKRCKGHTRDYAIQQAREKGLNDVVTKL